MAEKMTRILNVGSGPEEAEWAHITFEHLAPLEVIRLDIDPINNPDIVHDIMQDFPPELNEAFDVVFASHVLEHIPIKHVKEVFRRCVQTVQIGGQVAIVVPDIEFAAREVLSGRETLAVAMHIWGGQTDEFDYHKCGFTRSSLTIMFREAGCESPMINRKRYSINFNDTDHEAVQLFGIAKRRE